MVTICVVKFDGHGTNEACFVPESCLQSSKNVKIKINGDYLFIHKNDRQRRARGKLLFTGKREKLGHGFSQTLNVTVVLQDH
jgi:hypothetical protein